MTPITPSRGYIEAWDVESLTECGKTYVVSKRTTGSYACSCPAWKFARAPKPDCKHIRALRSDLTTVAAVRLVKVFFDSALVAEVTQEQAERLRANIFGIKRVQPETVVSSEFRIRRKFRLDE